MKSAPEKKFLIVIPLNGQPHYWLRMGSGNTPDINSAARFGEKQAKEICGKEPLLKMIPAPL
jgi:hypothetical protein